MTWVCISINGSFLVVKRKRIVMRSVIILYFVCIGLASCEKFSFLERNYFLKLTNKSPDTLAFALGYEYPNITLAENNNQLCVLAPNAFIDMSSEVKWKERIESLPMDTLLLFAIDVDTYRFYVYDKIRIKNNFAAFKKISVSDLQNDAGGEISYP